MEEAHSDASSEFAERVKFLQVGLEHARLTIELAAIHNNGNKDVQKDQVDDTRKALQKLVQFRKDHEPLFFQIYTTSYISGKYGIGIWIITLEYRRKTNPKKVPETEI